MKQMIYLSCILFYLMYYTSRNQTESCNTLYFEEKANGVSVYSFLLKRCTSKLVDILYQECIYRWFIFGTICLSITDNIWIATGLHLIPHFLYYKGLSSILFHILQANLYYVSGQSIVYPIVCSYISECIICTYETYEYAIY